MKYHNQKKEDKITAFVLILTCVLLMKFAYFCLSKSKNQDSIKDNAIRIIKKYEGTPLKTPNKRGELGYFSKSCYKYYKKNFEGKSKIQTSEEKGKIKITYKQIEISDSQIESCLSNDIDVILNDIERIGLKNLSEEIKASLTSLIYNTGLTYFMKSSLYKVLKEKNLDRAKLISEWMRIEYSKESGTLVRKEGLRNRRSEELAYFMKK